MRPVTSSVSNPSLIPFRRRPEQPARLRSKSLRRRSASLLKRHHRPPQRRATHPQKHREQQHDAKLRHRRRKDHVSRNRRLSGRAALCAAIFSHLRHHIDARFKVGKRMQTCNSAKIHNRDVFDMPGEA